jgi:membrane protein required for colicin V production
MLIDIIALVLFVLALFKGLRKGLVVAVFSLLAFVVGLAAALKLSTVVADYLGAETNISQRWLPVLAFLAVFIGVVLLVRLGAKAVEGMVQAAMLGWANRLGGFLLYFFLYCFVFSVLLFYAVQIGMLKESTLDASVVYPWLRPIGPWVIDTIAVLLPFLRNMFEKLESFFHSVSGQSAS